MAEGPFVLIYDLERSQRRKGAHCITALSQHKVQDKIEHKVRP